MPKPLAPQNDPSALFGRFIEAEMSSKRIGKEFDRWMDRNARAVLWVVLVGNALIDQLQAQGPDATASAYGWTVRLNGRVLEATREKDRHVMTVDLDNFQPSTVEHLREYYPDVAERFAKAKF